MVSSRLLCFLVYASPQFDLQPFGFLLWAPRSSLFIQHSDSQTLYVLIYVYDIVITGSHAGAIRGLIASLATEFAIKVCFFLCTILLVYKHGEMMRVLSYVRVNTSMT